MILHACLLAVLAGQEIAPRTHAVVVVQKQHQRSEQKTFAWFEGSFEELLAEAKKSKRLVFLDMWAEWCHYCKKLEKETFRDAKVVAAMKDVLCYSVDTEAKKNAAIIKRFKPHGLPTLIFLEPDAEMREVISGFLPPKEFLAEVERIKRNENTFSGLRQRIEKNPQDLDAHLLLAQKMLKAGDHRGHEQAIALIRRLDPEGRTAAARRLILEKLRKVAEAQLQPEPLYAFLESETDGALLFDGWYAVWKLEEYKTRVARNDVERDLHRKHTFAAARSLWPHVPKELWVRVGNNVAWSYWEGREHLASADLAWALEVAQTVAEAAPDQAHVIDTLACCLWAVGRRDEAIAQVERCIELEPHNGTWKERLASFTGSYAVVGG